MKKKQFITMVLVVMAFLSSCDPFGNSHDYEAMAEKIRKKRIEKIMAHKWQVEKWTLPYIFNKKDDNYAEWNYFDEKEVYNHYSYYEGFDLKTDSVIKFGKKWCPQSIYEFINDSTILLHSSCGQEYDDTIKWSIRNDYFSFLDYYNYYDEDNDTLLLKQPINTIWTIDSLTNDRFRLKSNTYKCYDGILIFKAVD